ncbi:MAG: diacylglycerol/lipid kinase family protein [Bacteroidales bacterium]
MNNNPIRLLFVVNPISGGIDKEPFLNKAGTLCYKYGIDYLVFRTSGSNDQSALCKVLEEYKPDKVASIGGDGTALFTALALLDFNIPMGIIPMGSANGMAAELSVNMNPMSALKDIVMSGVIGCLDLLVVNDKYYSIHIGDVGVNAQIVHAYDKDDNRGLITYAKYLIEELSKMEPFDIRVEANGETINETGVMVAICNSRKYGTGVPLNVCGNPMDGKFELVIVKKIDTTVLISAGLSRFNESFRDNVNEQVISTNKARIEFSEERLLQLDGEVIGNFKELDVNVLEGAIKLITNNDNPYVRGKKHLDR